MKIVNHQLNKLPGLAALPDEITAEGYDQPTDYTPNRDPDYIFRLDDVRVLLGHMTSDTSAGLLLWGHRGAGKSSLPNQLCAYLNRPLFSMHGHSSLEWEDFLGAKEIVDGDTITMDGPLVQAWQMPLATFLLEEADRIRTQVSVALNPLLDGYDIVHTLDSGRRIKRARDVRLVFTANTNGQGDMTGDYNSAVSMDTSLLDRVWAHKVPYPSPEEEFTILRKAVDSQIGDEQIRKSIAFANDVRYLHAGEDTEVSSSAQSLDVSGAIHTTISTRALCELWRVMSKFPYVDNPIIYALRLVVTNKCTPECADAIHKLAEAQFAGD